MPNKSKAKGNRFERQIVETCNLHNIKAVRAWGSNGRALGEHEEVDVMINNNIKVQAKCRKKLADHIKPNENVDVQIIKEDRGQIYVVQQLDDWLLMLKEGDK
jgi:Holliday junction resolvase